MTAAKKEGTSQTTSSCMRQWQRKHPDPLIGRKNRHNASNGSCTKKRLLSNQNMYMDDHLSQCRLVNDSSCRNTFPCMVGAYCEHDSSPYLLLFPTDFCLLARTWVQWLITLQHTKGRLLTCQVQKSLCLINPRSSVACRGTACVALSSDVVDRRKDWSVGRIICWWTCSTDSRCS